MRYLSINEVDTSTASDSDMPIDFVNGGQQSWINYVNDKLDKKSTWLAFTVISTVAFIILLLIIIFLRQRIKLSIALIVEGSR